MLKDSFIWGTRNRVIPFFYFVVLAQDAKCFIWVPSLRHAGYTCIHSGSVQSLLPHFLCPPAPSSSSSAHGPSTVVSFFNLFWVFQPLGRSSGSSLNSFLALGILHVRRFMQQKFRAVVGGQLKTGRLWFRVLKRECSGFNSVCTNSCPPQHDLFRNRVFASVIT